MRRNKRPQHCRRRLRLFESLEQRQMLASNLQNPTEPLDVNADNSVTPHDVLLIVNHLNRYLSDTSMEAPEGEASPYYLDTNGDSIVSPIDALLVVNWLNAEGEESHPASTTATQADDMEVAARELGILPSENNNDVMVHGTVRGDVGSIREAGLFVVQTTGEGEASSSPNRLVAPPAAADRMPLFMSGDGEGDTREVSFDGGERVALYIIPESSTDLPPEDQLSVTMQPDGSWSVGWEASHSIWPDTVLSSTREHDDVLFSLSAELTGGFPPIIVLSEGENFAVERSVTLDLGQDEGSRHLSFEVRPNFDSADDSAGLEDILLVSLVDPGNPSSTLLDRGQQGTTLFSLAGEDAEFVPGLVRFDGSIVDIDLTSLGSLSQGQLRLQLINSDQDNGSEVTIAGLTNVQFPEGEAGPVLMMPNHVVSTGGEFDLTTLSANSDVHVEIQNVRFDSTTSQYIAELLLHNTGAAIGANAAVVLPGLPAGLTVQNQSGVDADGEPYLNFRNALPSGGLGTGQMSDAIELTIDNPQLLRFALRPSVFTAPNQTPILDPIPELNVMPGQRLEVDLTATDPEGDRVTFMIDTADMLPSGTLNGSLVFTPEPADVGSYDFTLIASDGKLKTRRQVTLNVNADPVTTTRFAGTIHNTRDEPLAGLRLTIGSQELFTDANGKFFFETTDQFDADSIAIHGDTFTSTDAYPFMEKNLSFFLGREVFTGTLNKVDRIIYLPVLDMSTTVPIEQNGDTIVTNPNIPEAMLMIPQGSAMDADGNAVTGNVGFMQVPEDRIPRDLPTHILPATIYAIYTTDTKDVRFNIPAEFTVPNTAGYEPGTEMALWEVNPVTQVFEIVGKGRVSDDGTVIVTTEGGSITGLGGNNTANWRCYTPLNPNPDNPNNDDHNEDERCEECKADGPGQSDVELHSGSLREWHNLVTYQSLGATRGLSLHYDSERADPRPIIHFGYSGLPRRTNLYLVARLSFMRGDFEYMVPGAEPTMGLPGGENFWRVQRDVGDIRAALQQDFGTFPSGVYDFKLESGILPLVRGEFLGSTSTDTGQVLHVNSIDSVFGNGWGLEGLFQIVESPNGSVLLIDGDGGELFFDAAIQPGDPLVSPPGDFTELVEQADGTYTRTWPNATVHKFNADGFIDTIRDRNGNETQYEYVAPGRLMKMIDPVGLETTFVYTGDRVTEIVDPANRSTRFGYDAVGNLETITDPDGTTRQFSYDERSLMTGEIDKRGFEEQIFYNFAGKVEREIRTDGTEMLYDSVQAQVLVPSAMTLDPNDAPVVHGIEAAMASYADPNGNVTEMLLDKQGQMMSSRDSGGRLATNTRNSENLVEESTGGRGFLTEFEYDPSGNPTLVTDSIGGVVQRSGGGNLWLTGHDADLHCDGGSNAATTKRQLSSSVMTRHCPFLSSTEADSMQ